MSAKDQTNQKRNLLGRLIKTELKLHPHPILSPFCNQQEIIIVGVGLDF
jgi:hypothetical protein